VGFGAEIVFKKNNGVGGLLDSKLDFVGLVVCELPLLMMLFKSRVKILLNPSRTR